MEGSSSERSWRERLRTESEGGGCAETWRAAADLRASRHSSGRPPARSAGDRRTSLTRRALLRAAGVGTATAGLGGCLAAPESGGERDRPAVECVSLEAWDAAGRTFVGPAFAVVDGTDDLASVQVGFRPDGAPDIELAPGPFDGDVPRQDGAFVAFDGSRASGRFPILRSTGERFPGIDGSVAVRASDAAGHSVDRRESRPSAGGDGDCSEPRQSLGVDSAATAGFGGDFQQREAIEHLTRILEALELIERLGADPLETRKEASKALRDLAAQHEMVRILVQINLLVNERTDGNPERRARMRQVLEAVQPVSGCVVVLRRPGFDGRACKYRISNTRGAGCGDFPPMLVPEPGDEFYLACSDGECPITNDPVLEHFVVEVRGIPRTCTIRAELVEPCRRRSDLNDVWEPC